MLLFLFAAAAALVIFGVSKTVRKIIGDIFRRPTGRSVVLKIDGGDSVVLHADTPEEERRLIEAFIEHHKESSP